MFTSGTARKSTILENHKVNPIPRTESTQLKIEMSDLRTSLICSKYDEQDSMHSIDECERLRPQVQEAEASKEDARDAGKHGQRNSKNFTVHCGCAATNQIENKRLQSKTISDFKLCVKKNPDRILKKEMRHVDVRSLNESYEAMAAESGYGSLLSSSGMSGHLQLPPIKQNTDSPSMKRTWHARSCYTCMGCQDFVDCDHGDCSTSSSEHQHPAGQAQLDIVSRLKNHEPALMDEILSYLTSQDLVRFSGVNHEWREICEGNEETACKKSGLLEQEQERRENFKENYPKQNCPKQTVGASTPLGVVQSLGKPQASSTPAPRSSRSKHDMFVKKAESLLADESFTKCAIGSCTSPAKLTLHNQSAECLQCGYIFCTNCREKYHRGSPCEALRCKNTAMKPNGVSSGKSKKSLRRLSRLDKSL